MTEREVRQLIENGRQPSRLKLEKNDRGFEVLTAKVHPGLGDRRARLVEQSSTVGYIDGIDRPGSSNLWVGAEHNLSREDVCALVRHLQAWLRTGRLQIRRPAV